jgi:hypothetical protein
MLATSPYAMPVPPDITVESPRRQTVLVVECKFEKDESPAAASRLRNLLLSDGYLDVPAEAFFMLALPTIFHLWRPGVASEDPPSCSASAAPVLRSYLGRIAEKVPWPGAEGMGLAVSFWLNDLAASIRPPDASDADQMLVNVGLYELLKGGSVRRELTP